MLPNVLNLHHMDHLFSLLYQFSLYLLTRPYINPKCFGFVIIAASSINFCIYQDRIFPFIPLNLYFPLFFTTLFPGVGVGYLDVIICTNGFFCLPASKSVHQWKSLELTGG